MNELRKIGKKNYFYLKFLEISFILLFLTLIIIGIYSLFTPSYVFMAYYSYPHFPLFELILSILVIIGATMFWDSFRIPSALQHPLHSHYKNLGYILKKRPFHTLKIEKTPDIYFTMKIYLYKRESGEPCIFHLESMAIPLMAHDKQRFINIGEQFLLKPDLKRHRFATTCELEELDLRSFLLIRATELFLKKHN
ncbi:MAG: hypothetical protein ACTSRS_21090 [Candidatus Helarchaeota archaeon]